MSSIQDTIQSALRMAAQGGLAQAIDDLRRHLRSHADNAELHHTLGLLLSQAGQTDQSLFHLERSTTLAPARADFLSNYATSLSLTGRPAEACKVYDRAVQTNPDLFPAQLGLSSALISAERYAEAAQAAEQAARIEPRRGEPWVNRGIALLRNGRGGEAVRIFREGLEAAPDHPLLLMNVASALLYRPEASRAEIAEAHERLGSAMAHVVGTRFSPPVLDNDPERLLRVGYLVPDHREHDLQGFLRPILAAHDSARFHITCYAPRGAAMWPAPQVAGIEWVDSARYGDDALDQRIRADRIDILVDLGGHWAGGRTWVMMRRPAPVQVGYLGYPATTGMRTITHRIADATICPPNEEHQGVERLHHLGGCYACYSAPADAPEPAAPPSAAAGHVTFGSFTPTSRINERLVSLWARILSGLPGSRLLLLGPGLGSASAREAIAQLFTDAGVDPSRIQMLGHIESPRDRLAAYARVDVALDTHPCSHPLSVCEALWMGVPAVTLRGDRQSARTGASILAAAGLGDWIVDGEQAYVDKALSLANDAKARADLRLSLRPKAGAAPLCDAASHIRGLEELYRRLWRESCSNKYYSPPAGYADPMQFVAPEPGGPEEK